MLLACYRDFLGVTMLLYVIVAVPLNVAFAVDPELWSTLFFIDMIVVRLRLSATFGGCLLLPVISFELSLINC